MDKLNTLLNQLKNNYNATSLRLDVAAEVYTDNDIKILCDLAAKNNLSTTIKIGGCDSTSQIYMAKKYGVKSIIAPMIETPYALKKFIETCKKIYSENEIKNINLYPNIETITAYKNIDKILSIPEVKYVRGIVLGRDDMSGSMNLKNINSDEIFEIAKILSEKVKRYNIYFIIGGGIRPVAVEFLNKLHNIKHYETRMIVFDGSIISQDGISKAIEFEIEWLKNKEIKCKSDLIRINKLFKEINRKLI